MRDGGFISAHDFHIASLIALVLCGGDVDAGSLVSEEYLMALERQHFCGLLDHPKTQERIMGMLQHRQAGSQLMKLLRERHASLGGARNPHVQEVRSGSCTPSA